MTYGLGIDLGTTYSAAAVKRPGQPPEMVTLGRSGFSVPTVAFLADEGWVVGESAESLAAVEPERVARLFKRRLGDPTPLVIQGQPFSAVELYTSMLGWVIDQVATREGSPPNALTLTCPANWRGFRHDMLTDAAAELGIPATSIITEPEAAAVHYASIQRVVEGELVGVYDLGGGTFDAVVMRKTATGFEFEGPSAGIDQLGGVDFDEALMRVVLSSAGVDPLDYDQVDLVSANALRRACVEAKTVLSDHTSATVAVPVGGAPTTIRVTRAEFEDAIRPLVRRTSESFTEAVDKADRQIEDLSRILLIGGSSRVPLIGQIMSQAFARPLAVDADPKNSVALGAALTSVERAAATSNPARPFPPPTPPAPAPPDAVDIDLRETGTAGVGDDRCELDLTNGNGEPETVPGTGGTNGTNTTDGTHGTETIVATPLVADPSVTPPDAERVGITDLGIAGLEDPVLVGRGGAAIVYKAMQSSLRRTVAVKLLSTSWDESAARRFDREQRAMGRLSNMPGIVPVYESGLNARSVPYIVMPYYANGSLKDRSASEGPMGWERAADLVLEVAEAVGRAHSVGIVHRDIKPANILLSDTGRPLVTDFGLARLAEDTGGVATTAFTFTPAFCPPEVMDNAEPDPRADTYALAATYWALVEGHPPFTDPDTVLPMDAVLKRVLTSGPGPLTAVPAAVDAFITSAMSKRPEDRPADGAAFAQQFRAAMAGTAPEPEGNDSTVRVRQLPPLELPSAPPSTPQQRPGWDRSSRSGRSGRRPVVLAASAALVLVAGAAAYALTRDSGDDAAAVESGSGDDAAVEVAGVTTVVPSGVVVVEPGDTVGLLPLAVDPSSPASLETRRAAVLAARDVGAIDGFTPEVLDTLAIECSSELDGDAASAIGSTSAVALLGSTCIESVSAVLAAGSDGELSWIASDLRSATLTSGADGSEADGHVEGFFRTAPNDQFEGTIAAQFALDDLGATSAVIVQGDGPGADEIAAAFAAAFETSGVVSVVEVTDGSDLAEVAAAASDAEVAFWVLDADTAAALAEAAGPVAAGTARIAITDVLSSAAVQAEALLDTYVVVPMQPPAESTAATGRTLAELVAVYEEEFGEPVEDELAFASAYDAAVLALESVRSTASVADDGLTLDRGEFRTHLESAASDGLTGPLDCNFLGDCGSQSMAIVQIDGASLTSTEANVVKLFERQP